MRKRNRVLLVDDEPSITLSLGEILRSDGMDVSSFHSAGDALAELKRHNVDVIVTDISLADASGIELLQWVHENRLHTPVILITGAPSFSTALSGLRFGAFDYLTKPVTRDQITPAVRRAIHVRAQETEIRRLQRLIELRRGRMKNLSELSEEDSMARQLPAALDRLEFELHYQPRLDTVSLELKGFEALLRWHSPEIGPVPPAKFIPIAEKSGFIVRLGEWVLSQATTQILEWQNDGIRVVPIAVNVSARQFEKSDLVHTVRENLEKYESMRPSLLELEITESVIMRGVERTGPMLQSLSDLGLQLALDDFGTGYSSLSYLKTFPLHVLKIDRSFIKNLPGDAKDRAIISTIIQLAHSLDLRVVAEGVETEEQLLFLRNESCDEVQGFYLARPMSAAQAKEYLLSRGVV